MTTEEIKQRIETAIPGANAYVLDPMNDGAHLQAFVICPAFEGMPVFKQQQMVMAAIKDIFEIVHANPGKRVIFMITACEMTLEMFGDWGNMVGIRGVGVRLDGRICNTMKAFELSEMGIKPGLTVVLEPTQQRILTIIRKRREQESF